MSVIIPIAGKAGAGKGSVADFLKPRLEAKGLRVFAILQYGDYVKFVCSTYFGWDGKKDKKGRNLLQKIGTDIVRERCPNFWSDIVVNLISVFREDFDVFLIPDTRFPDEIYCHVGRPVFTIRVHRIGFESELTEEQKAHISETALDNWHFDCDIYSESGLDKLEKVVDDNFEEIYSNIMKKLGDNQ